MTDVHEKTTVDASREPDINRGQFFALPAGSTVRTPLALRLDGGKWELRCAFTDAAGNVTTGASATAGVAQLQLRLGIGRGVYQETLFVPRRGAVFLRAFDSCQVTCAAFGVGAGGLSLFVGARKLTGPLVALPLAGQTLAAGAPVVACPQFSTRMQFLAPAGSTAQFRDEAGVAASVLLVVPASGILEVQIPALAVDVVLTTVGASSVEWLAV